MRLNTSRGALRREAFEKLAVLSAQAPPSHAAHQDLTRLCSLYKTPGTSNGVAKGPIGIRELEVLIALCRASSSIESLEHAERLLQQITPYLSEAQTQTFRPSPFLRHVHPSPWEVLVQEVASALLNIGIKHSSLRSQVVTSIINTIDAYVHQGQNIDRLDTSEDSALDIDNASRTITFSVSLLGLLSALAEKPQVCTVQERASIIYKLQTLYSEKFMVTIEGTLSSVRNSHGIHMKEWKRLLRVYASMGRPLGAMLLQHAFTQYLASSAAIMVTPSEFSRDEQVLDYLLQQTPQSLSGYEGVDGSSLEKLTELLTEIVSLLDADADYLQVSSAWQQQLAFSTKASCLISFLCCSLANEDIADADVLMAWLDGILTDPVQLADERLASVTLKCMAILAKTSKAFASNLARSLPRFIVQGRMTSDTVVIAANCLADVLQLLPQDLVISTLYSLGNVLSTGPSTNRANTSLFIDGNGTANGTMNGSVTSYTQQPTGSSISLVTNDDEETVLVHAAVVEAIVAIARKCHDERITALAISMLVQKIGRVNLAVDAKIIMGSAALGSQSEPNDFRPLLKLYARLVTDALASDNNVSLQAVMDARMLMAKSIPPTSPLYEIYLTYLLDGIVSTSDVTSRDTKTVVMDKLAVGQISQILPPLAALAAFMPYEYTQFEDPEMVSALSRDAWFNLIAHDFSLGSSFAKKHQQELQTLAWYTPSLIDSNKADTQESGIDLNTVLRRGMSPQHAVQLKSQLIAALPTHETDIKSLNYAELTFLNAAHLVAVLRAQSGDCTRTLEYFLDPKFKSGALSNCLLGVALSAVDTYLALTMTGRSQTFAAANLAQQLARLLESCCHRIDKVQQVATLAADRIIDQVPSSLCQRTSLFALLELLSLMWISCLEAETDEYECKSFYNSTKGNVSLQLSDNFAYRQTTLRGFQQKCRRWVLKTLDRAPLDMKGLLQTYLSDYDDEEAYGRISMGRSFALELGSLIPGTDQRLGAIDRRMDPGVNTASDFVAQYTTRQEYRYLDTMSRQDEELLHSQQAGIVGMPRSALSGQAREITATLKNMNTNLRNHHPASPEDLRSVLRRAAAVLCKVDADRFGLAQQLVGVPFTAFSKTAIKLGVSLWMGVIKENPQMESRILVEIAEGWETTIQKKRGVFAQTFSHLDPFYVKEEFAPTDKSAITKRQQQVHDLIAPHFRLVQFLSSHFNAMRLSNSHTGRIFHRLMRVTLAALRHSGSHPLAREVHFHIILLALRVISYGTGYDEKSRWELKDQILSAALRWFNFPARWSFGGNKLQVKAEVQVISDVIVAIQTSASLGARMLPPMQSLQAKQELLLQLLQNEITRLNVWLSPLGQDTPNSIYGQQGKANDSAIAALVTTAWVEAPSLAVQMAFRYPSSLVQSQVRSLLVNYPEKAMHEPDALQIMLGTSMPHDVSSQLKYLLYWAPVNPITAVTYFLPAYGNHAFIVQYAMRALESHSVDVTFFYVPQIVQTLRYDLLGYVERYIVETAKFSGLFAHQIIWNIKANAFKDEDSQIPDPVKPTLDKVMDSLISSFSDEDRDFYEREFGFFSEVTSISGKLKPFIKRPKPEKKAKIEEELRKIQVDVGVYLPSNPDGVVVGIDRKSGKPLQSHAKAPYMATFRIRKERSPEIEAVDEQLDHVAEEGEPRKETSYEVWQSAIFKVGDDCRQDVLALQMIAAFRGIFNNVGLDVYVFPYRVTATAPGCGVIDVLPNSISRDMLGREAVNGLYEYWVSKYGTEDSLRFQQARSNFVKSMAAYSVISYLLQFKDRHNGNIMVDDAGHILHIDFGFIFDIAPGGVKFERAPFKLTGEMIAVMGGSTQSQPFKWFEELCVKAFLAARQHAEKLSHLVIVMLDSGLPCFKPETIQHFKERFVLDKSEREAADFMRSLVRWSGKSHSTGVYDQFQLLTNGIPY
ncbi:phosphatidylinositol 3 [Aureobasidium pullulans]|uniref:1-phosphatidylinositol 4-kinase n=1 Tax=Aureobasidium pullulans TaxID=5580 RepID=A0A4V6TC80_AURPU|nr:phosphatidylinositol 3 [Aureobasidium pullulans]